MVMNVEWINHWAEQNKTTYPVTQTHFFSLNNPVTNMPTQWIETRMWKENKTDFRTIHWNELIFDIDEKEWHKVRRGAYDIIDVLLGMHSPFYPYLSAGKGVHISSFLSTNGLENKLDWMPIRKYIARIIMKDIKNVNIDLRKIEWDDYSMGSLLRAEGGMRWAHPKQLEDFWWKGGKVPCYKSYVTEIPDTHNFIHNYKEVQYPSILKQWIIPQSMIREIEDNVNMEVSNNNHSNSKDIRPCIKNRMIELSEGINLSHLDRVMIVAELWAHGWTKDKIIDLFKSSPDWNRKITEYQVEHITSVPYKRFTCSKIQEINSCMNTCELVKK